MTPFPYIPRLLSLWTVLLVVGLLALTHSACDSAGTNAIEPLEPFEGLNDADKALVARVFHDVEALFELG